MTDRHRSAITGEFVTAEHAAANPDTTVSEARDHQTEPIVRTVGDLTARHIGKRVRVGSGVGVLTEIFTDDGRVGLMLDDLPGVLLALDTPCEVLP